MSDFEDENQLVPAVVTKYQIAGSLKTLLPMVKEGETVLNLCKLGDDTIKNISSTVFNKGKVQKGIAFPTCISVNHLLCHVSPLPSDPEAQITLKNGDTVRIELGAHVDGYIAQVATTVVVGQSKESPVTGEKANAIQAAYLATEAVIRLIKPGNNNLQVIETIKKVTQEFECNPVDGMTTQQLLRNVLDGPKQITVKSGEQKDEESFEFELGQVYAVDVMVSSKAGKPKASDCRTTIFKRNPNATYQLKMKASRAVFSQIQKECGTMAFSLAAFDDEKKSRMGITECQTHQLVTPYPVMTEEAEVGHFAFTILVMPNGPLRISSFEFDQESINSEKSIQDEDLKTLLSTPYRKEKKSKK